MERVKVFSLGCVWTSRFPWCLIAEVACSCPTVAVNLCIYYNAGRARCV